MKRYHLFAYNLSNSSAPLLASAYIDVFADPDEAMKLLSDAQPHADDRAELFQVEPDGRMKLITVGAVADQEWSWRHVTP